MSNSVLFDVPGPTARARHRIYTVVGTVGLGAMVAWAAWQLQRKGQFEYELWEPFATPDYLRALFVDGVLQTVQMAFGAVIGAVLMGVALGLGKLSDHAIIRWPAWVIVEFFRALPVLLMMVFVYFAFFIDYPDPWDGFLAVITALTLYNGAVLAEVFRAGVLAVPRGQAEAAYAMGMRKSQVMRLILLPQAVKIMLPAIISQCVVALKDTSLGYAIVAPGLTYVGKQIYIEFHNHVPTMFVISATYIVLNLILTWLATWVQKRFVGEKKVLEVPIVAGLEPKELA